MTNAGSSVKAINECLPEQSSVVEARYVPLLDYARFFAAVAVLGFHYLYSGIVNHKIITLEHADRFVAIAKYGYLGVEFFFMISGYVIFYSAAGRSAASFISARFVRLYPTFWICLLITSLASVIWMFDSMSVDLFQVMANFTMFPKLFGENYVDGVYWTLRYEWNFYLLVFFVLFLFGSSRLSDFVLYFPVYIFLGYFILDDLPLSGGYYAYFASGSLFALAQQRRVNIMIWFNLAISSIVCFHFSLSNAVSMSAKSNHFFSPFVVAFIISVMFLFFLCLRFCHSRGVDSPFSRTLGAVTYPLYLLHAHLGFMLLSSYADESNKWVAYACTALLVALLAYFVHRLVDRWATPVVRTAVDCAVKLPLEFVESRWRAIVVPSRFRGRKV